MKSSDLTISDIFLGLTHAKPSRGMPNEVRASRQQLLVAQGQLLNDLAWFAWWNSGMDPVTLIIDQPTSTVPSMRDLRQAAEGEVIAMLPKPERIDWRDVAWKRVRQIQCELMDEPCFKFNVYPDGQNEFSDRVQVPKAYFQAMYFKSHDAIITCAEYGYSDFIQHTQVGDTLEPHQQLAPAFHAKVGFPDHWKSS